MLILCSTPPLSGIFRTTAAKIVIALNLLEEVRLSERARTLPQPCVSILARDQFQARQIWLTRQKSSEIVPALTPISHNCNSLIIGLVSHNPLIVRESADSILSSLFNLIRSF
jgi:hypothetical protein